MTLDIAESFGDKNLWVEPKTRDGVRDRGSVARLIGGSTPGPGNIGLQSASFSVNKSSSVLSVGLVRTNGVLGPGAANFSIQSGTALSGTGFLLRQHAAGVLDRLAIYQHSPPACAVMACLETTVAHLQDVFASLVQADSLINNQFGRHGQHLSKTPRRWATSMPIPTGQPQRGRWFLSRRRKHSARRRAGAFRRRRSR
jgi:hypothetical protein